MLTIIDVANHQRGLRLDTLSADAFIFKITEGNYFKDDTVEDFIQQARALNRPFGLYHFLDQSPIEEQVDFFLSYITPYIGECLLVLDYEDYGRQGTKQAKLFLDIIYQKTQIKPLIYMNESDANAEDWSEVISADYGLWIAKYSSNLPELAQWPNYAMWQYTSTPYDTSYFYGDLHAWKKYGLPETNNSTNYHLKGKRFKALKPLIIKADEWFKKDTGMFFSKSTVFDIQTICHTETTTHALIYYNHREVFVTLHKDYVELVE